MKNLFSICLINDCFIICDVNSLFIGHCNWMYVVNTSISVSFVELLNDEDGN